MSEVVGELLPAEPADVIDQYTEALFRLVENTRLFRPLTDEEKIIINEANNKRLLDPEILFTNSVNNQHKTVPLRKLINFCIKEGAILTGYGSWFKNQHKFDSSICKLLKFLMEGRDVVKGKMNALLAEGIAKTDLKVSTKDTEQKIWKLLANSFYGAYGERGFIFFNPDMGPSITYTGRMIIGHTLYSFETTLDDNHFFINKEDVSYHLMRCVESYIEFGEEFGKFGENPHLEECTYEHLFNKIVGYCHPTDSSWIPEEVVKEALDNIPESFYPAIFFRGQMAKFLEYSNLKSGMIEHLQDYDIAEAEYKWMEKKKPASMAFLNEIWGYIRHWVASPYLIPNIEERVLHMKRRVVILTDTDSCFLGVDKLLLWTRDVLGLDIEDPDKQISHVNFYILIMRLMSDHCMMEFGKGMNVPEDYRWMLYFKSEYFYKRLILTNGKKNYIGLMTYQEGSKLRNKAGGLGEIDIKGLQIKKSGTAKATGKMHKDLIETYLLRSEEMDRFALLNKLTQFEQDIYRDVIDEGSLNFVKPASYKNPKFYKNPEGMPIYRGVTTWNALFPDDPIKPSETARICKISVLNNYDLFLEHMEAYDGDDKNHIIDTITRLYFDEKSNEKMAAKGLNWFAMPYNIEQIPAWLRPMINIRDEVSSNIAPILPILESVDIRVASGNVTTFTNILKF